MEVSLVGSVGEDDKRVALERIVSEDGVTPRFSAQPHLPTGHCVALVCGMERTMCANVGAAGVFAAADYDKLGVEKVLERAKMVYLTSFFAKHSWDVVEKIADVCGKKKIQLAFNLNGEYVFQDPNFVKRVVALIPK